MAAEAWNFNMLAPLTIMGPGAQQTQPVFLLGPAENEPPRIGSQHPFTIKFHAAMISSGSFVRESSFLLLESLLGR